MSRHISNQWASHVYIQWTIISPINESPHLQPMTRHILPEYATTTLPEYATTTLPEYSTNTLPEYATNSMQQPLTRASDNHLTWVCDNHLTRVCDDLLDVLVEYGKDGALPHLALRDHLPLLVDAVQGSILKYLPMSFTCVHVLHFSVWFVGLREFNFFVQICSQTNTFCLQSSLGTGQLTQPINQQSFLGLIKLFRCYKFSFFLFCNFVCLILYKYVC